MFLEVPSVVFKALKVVFVSLPSVPLKVPLASFEVLSISAKVLRESPEVLNASLIIPRGVPSFEIPYVSLEVQSIPIKVL
jgi:hypothetical protein